MSEDTFCKTLFGLMVASFVMLFIPGCNPPKGWAFALGDKVQLNSGGPIMTITDLESTGFVEVHWFDTRNMLHAQDINPDGLHKVVP